MVELSRGLNPECEHLVGDMRTLRLGREFDVVFVHDAVNYLTTLEDLGRAIQTAYVHLRPGGVALFAPDHVRERFVPHTSCGGNDGVGRALRYLEWTWDPDPTDTTYNTEFVCVLREDGKPVWTENELHLAGLFSRAEWLERFAAAGFQATSRIIEFGPDDIPGAGEHFVAVKPR
jgi:hypothetical protein